MMVGKVDVCMGDYCVDVVVGAGPAGSSAAFLLAERGFSVMLLNRSVFPRDKVCGGGLTPACVEELGRMGLGRVLEGYPRVTAAHIVGPSGQTFQVDLSCLTDEGASRGECWCGVGVCSVKGSF